MSTTLRTLVVDDDAGVRYTLRGLLEDLGAHVDEAVDGQAGLERLAEGGPYDLVLTDLRMPRVDGMALLERGTALARGARFVMVTAHGSERHAVLAMKCGAWDYVTKPFDLDEISAIVARASEAAQLTRERDRLEGELHLSRSVLFASPAMARLAELVRRVAPRDVTVLLTGESGTGKERVADALVQGSRRAQRPFLRFNCAALTRELAEAELFGHARGAFTGATRARLGLFREAEGGTLLLDEIGELDLGVQAKLLRVLQEREVRPLGEDRDAAIDVRILAATHRDLGKLVAEGRFREDLHYRLKVVELTVPPLRERPEDIPLLAHHFLRRFAERFGVAPVRIPEALMAKLVARAWPGNVRELENTLEGLVALSSDGELDATLLSMAAPHGDPEPPAASLRQRVDAYERGIVAAALAAARGNRTEAARALGIGRATLHEKMAKYRLQ